MAAPWLAQLETDGIILSDWDNFDGTALLTPGGGTANIFGNNQVAGSLTGTAAQVRPYYRAALASVGQAWDAAGNGNMTWSLLINNSAVYPFQAKVSQYASPYGDTLYLPKPIWIPNPALLQMTANMSSSASGNAFFTGRVIVYYFQQNPNLQKILSLPGKSHLPHGYQGTATIINPPAQRLR